MTPLSPVNLWLPTSVFTLLDVYLLFKEMNWAIYGFTKMLTCLTYSMLLVVISSNNQGSWMHQLYTSFNSTILYMREIPSMDFPLQQRITHLNEHMGPTLWEKIFWSIESPSTLVGFESLRNHVLSSVGKIAERGGESVIYILETFLILLWIFVDYYLMCCW